MIDVGEFWSRRSEPQADAGRKLPDLVAQQNSGVPKRILSPADKDVDSERPSEAGRLLPPPANE